MDDYNKSNVEDNNSNVEDNSNSDISSEVNEQDNSTSENVQSGNEQSNDNGIGNGYNQLASSNREAFTKGLNQNYADRIAQNKANLEQARARSRETQKTNNKGEQQDKNGLDKVKDQANILKSKASLLSTKIDSARAGAYKAMHPVEAAKIAAKEAAKKKIITIALSSAAGCSPFLLGVFVVFIAVLLVLGIFNTDISANTGSKAQECGFTISRTSLSKTEYKNKLEEFAKTNSVFQIFADNANGIYEYSQSKGVNPELTIIRAYAEVGVDGKRSAKNNYWGMNCTNTGGGRDCYNYDTFEEGYQDFVNNISQYDSLTSMMSKYAHIGGYWYSITYNNKGEIDWGIGGCVYVPYIYEATPERVKKACATDAPKCTKKNTSNCTTTTAEDQEAYMKYQIKIMSDYRYNIFGLEENEGPCNNNNSIGSGNAITSQPNFASDAWKDNINPYSSQKLYGQCTWFAWGRFYEIYGYSPGFTGNGYECASQLVAAHGDKFELSNTPKAGAVFSSIPSKNHVGIVVGVNGENLIIQEGNLDGYTNTFEGAKTDWQERHLTLQELRTYYGAGVVFANPK